MRSNSRQLPPDEEQRSSNSYSARDRHHSSKSPSPSPPPRRSSRDHRFRDEPYPIPPYYPPYDYPDYGRIPPPPYHSHPPFPRRRKKHMYHLESDKRTKVHTVFMFNLSYKMNNEQLLKFCSQYGEVSELIYPLSKLGMGFVTYYDIRNAEKAVKEMNGMELNGRIMHTNFAYRPPAHSKRKAEDICANVFAKIESVQNKLQLLRDSKKGAQNQSNESKNDSKSSIDSDQKKDKDFDNEEEDDDEINREMTQFVAGIDINSEIIKTTLSKYGEVRSVDDDDYGIYLVKFYDIRSARKCVEEHSCIINSENVVFEYAPEAELGDDETNSEFSQEEYYRQFRKENNERKSDSADNSENEDDKSKSIQNDDDNQSRDGDRGRDRGREYDRGRRRDYEMPQHHRGGPGGRRFYPPPMNYGYPPYPPYGPPMGWYPPYPGPQMPPHMKRDSRGGRHGGYSRR